VSSATVSHVLNGTRYVAKETDARVRQAMDELRYEVNSVAQSLKLNRSRMLGLIVSDIANPFFTALVRGVDDVARSRGYTLILCNSELDPEQELRYLRLLRQKRADGMVLASTGVYHRYYDQLIEGGCPLVCVDQAIAGLACDAVLLDNEAGAYDAVTHLIRLGHRRIGIVGGAPVVATSGERLAGYRRALREHNLAEDLELVREGNSRMNGGYDRTLELVDLPRPPSAIFTTNNLTTLGAMAALRRRGLRVPDDVAVVGFDDFEWTEFFQPRLTTVAQPTDEFGRSAGELLIARIEHGMADKPKRVVLSPRLIVRESCGAGSLADSSDLERIFAQSE
jgi:LacI family transcriptional regulator